MADPIKLRIGRNLRQLREERGMTQEEISHECNVSWRSWQRWERGHAQPTWKSIVQVSGELGIDTEEIIGTRDAGALRPEPLEDQVAKLMLKVSMLETQFHNLAHRREGMA